MQGTKRSLDDSTNPSTQHSSVGEVPEKRTRLLSRGQVEKLEKLRLRLQKATAEVEAGKRVLRNKEKLGTTGAQPLDTPGGSGGVELVETKKERRERENNECIGGLRSPWKSVQKLPKLREVGRQLRRILEDFLDAHPKFENMPQGGQQAEELEEAQEVEELRRIIAEVLGTEDSRACDNGSPWRAGLLQAHVNKTNDPESGLPRWLREGSPIGVARPVEPVGIFPRVDPEGKDRGALEEILSEVAARNNYKSFEEAKKYAEPEVQRIIAAGYAKDLGTWKDVVKAYGKVAVSKLACIVKVRKNGSIKARLVIDLRRSGVNRCVHPFGAGGPTQDQGGA